MNDRVMVTNEAPTRARVEESPIPSGHVRRRLSMRDRQVILAACVQHAGGEKREGDAKALRKLARLQDLLKADAVEDYYGELERRYQLEIAAWRKGLEEAVKAGGREIQKPPRPAPDELEGPTESFDLPSYLDAWIKEALGAAKFPVDHARAVAKVMELYEDREG